MRIFEKFVHKTAHTICDTIGLDQFAYEEGLNTIMALTRCQHMSLKWFENDTKYDLVKFADDLTLEVPRGNFMEIPKASK